MFSLFNVWIFFFFYVFGVFFLSPQNNTSWRPQSCQECTCYGDVAICRPAHCPNPKCDFQRVRRHFFLLSKTRRRVSQCFNTTSPSLCVLRHMEHAEHFHHTGKFVFLFCRCFSRTLCNLLWTMDFVCLREHRLLRSFLINVFLSSFFSPENKIDKHLTKKYYIIYFSALKKILQSEKTFSAK